MAIGGKKVVVGELMDNRDTTYSTKNEIKFLARARA
jgi:hypothetical protein